MPNPCELPRHMYYLSYSADGEQAHPPAGMYPSAPCTPEPDGPRAAVLPERDPLANSSQLGAGKVNLQFSEDTRWAFRRTPEQAARCPLRPKLCPQQLAAPASTPPQPPDGVAVSVPIFVSDMETGSIDWR